MVEIKKNIKKEGFAPYLKEVTSSIRPPLPAAMRTGPLFVFCIWKGGIRDEANLGNEAKKIPGKSDFKIIAKEKNFQKKK